MEVSARSATSADVPQLVRLYRPALEEQVVLREAWGVAEGLAEPIPDTLHSLLDDEDSLLAIGMIDGVAVGFIWARIESLLPQAGEEKLGVIRLVYVDQPAREVGVGESMLGTALAWLRERGISRFDAIVSPGHRLAKNFFESAGFSARRITMYHRDEDDE